MRSTAVKIASGPSETSLDSWQGGDQVAGEIRHGDEQFVGRDVHAEDVAGLRAQPQAAGRPTAGGRPEPVGLDEPQGLQLADALGDDAAAEADALGQHRLRDALFGCGWRRERRPDR